MYAVWKNLNPGDFRYQVTLGFPIKGRMFFNCNRTILMNRFFISYKLWHYRRMDKNHLHIEGYATVRNSLDYHIKMFSLLSNFKSKPKEGLQNNFTYQSQLVFVLDRTS